MKKPVKAGRPTKLTDELMAELCARLSEGRSLRSVCEDPDMPGQTSVFRHLAQSAPFREQYARAREASADAMFEAMLHIAGTPQLGKRIKEVDGKREVIEADMIEHRRLLVDTLKWSLARMAPKKYGDAGRIQVSGPDGGPVTLLDVAAVEAYVRQNRLKHDSA